MVLVSVNAGPSSFPHTAMNVMSATMVILNANFATVTRMEPTVMYAKWEVANVLAKRIMVERTVIGAKKNIMDFLTASVSIPITFYFTTSQDNFGISAVVILNGKSDMFVWRRKTIIGLYMLILL